MKSNSMMVLFTSAGASLDLNAGSTTQLTDCDIEHITSLSSLVSSSVQWGNNSICLIGIVYILHELQQI